MLHVTLKQNDGFMEYIQCVVVEGINEEDLIKGVVKYYDGEGVRFEPSELERYREENPETSDPNTRKTILHTVGPDNPGWEIKFWIREVKVVKQLAEAVELLIP